MECANWNNPQYIQYNREKKKKLILRKAKSVDKRRQVKKTTTGKLEFTQLYVCCIADWWWLSILSVKIAKESQQKKNNFHFYFFHDKAKQFFIPIKLWNSQTQLNVHSEIDFNNSETLKVIFEIVCLLLSNHLIWILQKVLLSCFFCCCFIFLPPPSFIQCRGERVCVYVQL